MEGFRSCVWVPLPAGWEEFRDAESKRTFYVNRSTGEKSWVRPDQVVPDVRTFHATTGQDQPVRGKIAQGNSPPSKVAKTGSADHERDRFAQTNSNPQAQAAQS